MITNTTANVVLFDNVVNYTVNVLDLNTTVLEFFKNDTDTVTIQSTSFGINEDCSSETCYYAAPISATPDLNVTYQGMTTMITNVAVTSTSYYSEL